MSRHLRSVAVTPEADELPTFGELAARARANVRAIFGDTRAARRVLVELVDVLDPEVSPAGAGLREAVGLGLDGLVRLAPSLTRAVKAGTVRALRFAKKPHQLRRTLQTSAATEGGSLGHS